MLRVTADVDPYVRRLAVLVGYAESDYISDAVQHGKTFGVFQQMPAYWPTAMLGAAAQCLAFLEAVRLNARHLTGDLVHDAWIVQRWSLPGAQWPDTGPLFESEKRRVNSETWNYWRRLPDIDRIITERRLP